MPPQLKVDLFSDVIDAVYSCFPKSLRNGEIPAYSDKFYKDVSKKLNGKWSAHNVYTYLYNNRKGLKTTLFEKLGISVESVETLENIEKSEANDDCNNNQTWNECGMDGEGFDVDDDFTENIRFSKIEDNPPFDLWISTIEWQHMKPKIRVYKGREHLVLTPRVWTDIVTDNFWKQYRMPCVFTFKNHKVFRDRPDKDFLYIVGKCKSIKCKNTFFAVAKKEPGEEENLKLDVHVLKDTRDDLHHEIMQRQLRNKKREMIGAQVLRHGAANCRRKLGAKEINLGKDVNPPMLYSSDVLRKLLQECRDKELGVDAKDGSDPIRILQQLKYTSPYVGSIGFIGLDELQVHYLLTEQSFVFKEYCRLYKKNATVCIGSTAGLVKPVKIIDNVDSPVVFLYEIVINFEGITLSVGQMLSAAQDTNTILFFINKWLVNVGIKPKEAVSDYSKALLGAMSLVFNNMTLKDYMRECFLFATMQKSGRRPAATFIRIDVAHFIAIFCRLKCFTTDNKAIKDFLLRCIALMISCENFNRLQEILLLTMTISIHSYAGEMLDTKELSPAESARMKLLNYIATEEHNAMKLIPDEHSKTFKNTIQKLESTGLDMNPDQPKCFIYQEPEVDKGISDWFKNLKIKAEEGMDVTHGRANAYRLPKFYNHLCRLAPEFVLWTAVMLRNFDSGCIRATSCYVEGDFGELKTNVLGHVHRPLRLDKIFRFHFEALQGQTRIASCALLRARTNKIDEVAEDLENELPSNFNHESQILAHSTSLHLETERFVPNSHNETYVIGSKDSSQIALNDFNVRNWSQERCDPEPDSDLEEKENWRNEGDEEDPLLSENIVVNTIGWERNSILTEHFEKPDSILKETENWRNRIRKEDSLLHRSIKFDLEYKGNLKKRKDNVGDRKPSKFFRKCPDIQIRQNAPAALPGTKGPSMLLKNGSNLKPIKLYNRVYGVKDTCPFDSIAEILAEAANDSVQYLQHLQDSRNDFCGFILEYAESGAKAHIYAQRCRILRDFRDPQKPNPIIFDGALYTFSVFSNVFDMWTFLVNNEPSMYRRKKCNCGFEDVEEIPIVYVDHNIINREGFRAIQKAILVQHQTTQEPCSRQDCGLLTNVKTSVNDHIFIEADIRSRDDARKSMTCKVRDFPIYLLQHGEKFRLTGIVIHNGINHYIALCRNVDGSWQMHNDVAKRVTTFKEGDYNKAYIPQAVICIKVAE